MPTDPCSRYSTEVLLKLSLDVMCLCLSLANRVTAGGGGLLSLLSMDLVPKLPLTLNRSIYHRPCDTLQQQLVSK